MGHSKLSVAPLAAFALLAGMVAQASAVVVISIGNISAAPGTTALVPVFATSNTADQVSGFNFPIDLNNDGYNLLLPPGFSLNAMPFQDSLFGTVAFNRTTPILPIIGTDGIANASSSVNTTLSTTPTLFFNLAVDVAPNAVIGSVFPLQIEAPGDPFSAQFNVAGPNSPVVAAPTIGQPVSGSVTVIPEPASLAAVGASLLALGTRRRTRKGR